MDRGVAAYQMTVSYLPLFWRGGGYRGKEPKQENKKALPLVMGHTLHT